MLYIQKRNNSPTPSPKRWMGREIHAAHIDRKYSSYISSFKNHKCMVLLYSCSEVQSSIQEDNQYNVGSERIKVPLCFFIYSISKLSISLAGPSQGRHKNNCKLWKNAFYSFSNILCMYLCCAGMYVCIHVEARSQCVCLSQYFCVLYFFKFYL